MAWIIINTLHSYKLHEGRGVCVHFIPSMEQRLAPSEEGEEVIPKDTSLEVKGMKAFLQQLEV